MEYVALKASYGMNGGYIEKGEVVFISDEEKALIDEAYFNDLFKPVESINIVPITDDVSDDEEDTEEVEETEDIVEEAEEEKPKRTYTRKTTKK